MNFREQALHNEIEPLQKRNALYVESLNERVMSIAFGELKEADLRLFADEFICNIRYPEVRVFPEDKPLDSINELRMLFSTTIEGLIKEMKGLLAEYKNTQKAKTFYILGIYMDPSDDYHLKAYIER